MQKPIVLSVVNVDFARFGCFLQPAAAVSPCHTSAARKTSLYLLLTEKIPLCKMPSVWGRNRLVDLGTVGNIFKLQKMSSHV